LCEQSTKDGTSEIILFAQTSKSISYQNYEKNKNKFLTVIALPAFAAIKETTYCTL
jgi:hypothetical protein